MTNKCKTNVPSWRQCCPKVQASTCSVLSWQICLFRSLVFSTSFIDMQVQNQKQFLHVIIGTPCHSILLSPSLEYNPLCQKNTRTGGVLNPMSKWESVITVPIWIGTVYHDISSCNVTLYFLQLKAMEIPDFLKSNGRWNTGGGRYIIQGCWYSLRVILHFRTSKEIKATR